MTHPEQTIIPEYTPVATAPGEQTLPAINRVIETLGPGGISIGAPIENFESYNPAHEAWGKSLEALAASVPEIAEEYDTIERGGRVLLDELEINGSLFEQVPHTVMFTALSQRKANLEAARGSLDTEAYDAENTFIHNATMLLALQRSGLFEQVKRDIYDFDVFDERAIGQAYDRFTNVQMTAELKTAIDDGLLDSVKVRLGISEDNEDPYVLHVLNVGDDRTLGGMHPEPLLNVTDPDMIRQWREGVAVYSEYAQGLSRKSEQFKADTGMSVIPLAWMVPINGRRHLNIALPTAEKLLHPEDVRLGKRRETDGQQEQAILEHEYAHTQGSMALDEEVFYGIAFEERRAELFASNKLGYEDVKGFLDFDMIPLTRTSLKDSMRDAVKGGRPEKLYVQLAQRIGLQSTLELALTPPAGYVDDRRPMQRDVYAYLGGINGVEERIYDRMGPEQREVFEIIMNEWATNNAPRPIESWLNTRERQFGLSFVTQKLRDALHAKRKELEIQK